MFMGNGEQWDAVQAWLEATQRAWSDCVKYASRGINMRYICQHCRPCIVPSAHHLSPTIYTGLQPGSACQLKSRQMFEQHPCSPRPVSHGTRM